MRANLTYPFKMQMVANALKFRTVINIFQPPSAKLVIQHIL